MHLENSLGNMSLCLAAKTHYFDISIVLLTDVVKPKIRSKDGLWANESSSPHIDKILVDAMVE